MKLFWLCLLLLEERHHHHDHQTFPFHCGDGSGDVMELGFRTKSRNVIRQGNTRRNFHDGVSNETSLTSLLLEERHHYHNHQKFPFHCGDGGDVMGLDSGLNQRTVRGKVTPEEISIMVSPMKLLRLRYCLRRLHHLHHHHHQTFPLQ